MRAAIYTRISRDRAGAGLGVERQEQDCRALAEHLGWNVVTVHSDNDLSAYARKPRPAYRELLDDMRAGRIDAVIAWHTDRLHRRLTDLEELITLLETREVTVATVTAGDLDLSTASGRRNARILASVAQGEVEQTRERTRAAKAQAAAAGKWRGGRRPFGYEADGVTVEPREAEALLTAARGVLAGRTLMALARDMNDAEITTANGLALDSVALRNLLRRPRNAALIDQYGKIIGPAQWPAIIPEDTWRAVLATLNDPSRTTTTGPERRWLGSGIYVCGICGERLTTHSTRHNRKAYRCPVQSHVTRSLEPVDELVRAAIVARVDNAGLDDLIRPTDNPADTALRADSEELRARLAVFESDYAEGAITGAQLAKATARVQAELDDVGQRLAAQARGTALTVLNTRDPSAAFLAAPLDVQRAVLDALAVVTIHPGRKGRPPGWVPGERYVDLDSVKIKWRAA